MKLRRTALADLIPGTREGFHTAILTTFSFDFYFFEMVLLRRFRSIGIRNVLVLADAALLHEATRFSTGFGASRTKTYNLVPIPSKGAFHPKMTFLLGKKSGWLAIGSGNLTESGFGKNDEVWGAFYFSADKQIMHGSLFAEAWDFIKLLEGRHLLGFAKKQIADAEHFTPWLDDLPRQKSGQWLQVDDSHEILLVHSGHDASIWEQLTQHLPAAAIERVTIVSPFFDVEGNLLQRFSEQFPTASVRVVVESGWGALPIQLDESVQEQIQFYDWKKLNGIPPDSSNRWLHAKLFVFETKALGSFCLFGSSNASPSGFGLNRMNHEVNLLIHKNAGNILEELGIKLKTEALLTLPTAVENAPSSPLPDHHIISFDTYIIMAELDGQQLSIHLTEPLHSQNARLVVFDAEGLELQSTETAFDQTRLNFQCSGNELPYACQIMSAEKQGHPLSNRQVIAHLAALRRTSPDPGRAKFEALLDRLRDGENTAIAQILSLLDLERPETNETLRERGATYYQQNSAKEEGANDIEVSETEFSKIPEHRIYSSYYLHYDPAHDLSDFLLQIGLSSVAHHHETDGSEDEELVDVETGERKDGVSMPAQQPKKADTTDREAAAVKKFLNKYRRVLTAATANYLKAPRRKNHPTSLTSRDLSIFLIALRLMVRYGDRKSTAFPAIPFRHGVVSAWKPNKMDSVQMACYEVIGKMLLLLNAGIRTPQTTQEQNRLHDLKEAIFYDLVFLLASALTDKGRDSKYAPLFHWNLMLHFREFLPVPVERLREQMKKRGDFGAGISSICMERIEQDISYYSEFFNARLADKDIQKRHRISMGDGQFLLLEKAFGVSLSVDKRLSKRCHPGGTSDGEGEYFLNV